MKQLQSATVSFTDLTFNCPNRQLLPKYLLIQLLLREILFLQPIPGDHFMWGTCAARARDASLRCIWLEDAYSGALCILHHIIACLASTSHTQSLDTN